MSNEENEFQNIPNNNAGNAAENKGNSGTPPAPTNTGTPSPANNSPSLGEKLGEAPVEPVVASNTNSNAANSPPKEEKEAVEALAPASAAPPLPNIAAPLAPAANKPKKAMTLGQKQLQEERAKTLQMMRDAYSEVFGDDKKAPKAKAYEAAGLTTIRLKEGEEAFRTKLYDTIIARNQGVYMNRAAGVTKKVIAKNTKKAKAVTFKNSIPATTTALNNSFAVSTKAVAHSPSSKGISGKTEEYLDRSYSSAVKAVRSAKKEALEKAAKNFRAVASRTVADKLIQIMHSEGGAASANNARLFSEICQNVSKYSPASSMESNSSSNFNASKYNLSRRANSIMPLNNSPSKKKTKTKKASPSKKRSSSRSRSPRRA